MNVATKTEHYHELKKRHNKEISDFPMAFAFSNEQLGKALVKLRAEKKEVISVGAGTIIKRENKKAFLDLFHRHMEERQVQMKNETYLYEMFLYELGNHEYCITYDLADTLDACDVTDEMLKQNPNMKAVLDHAISDYWENQS